MSNKAVFVRSFRLKCQFLACHKIFSPMFQRAFKLIAQIHGQGVNRASDRRNILPRRVQLIYKRKHNAKGCIIQTHVLRQIAQQLCPP
jgi:hypothetical protein